MSKNRKDEHIALALSQEIKSNWFDKIKLNSMDLPDLSVQQIDLSTSFLGYQTPYPFYINAMTGGSINGGKINDFLSKIAKHFNLPMVTGSQSIIFKDELSKPTFEVIRKNHDGIVVGNLNANATVKQANDAINLIKADGLSIHLNVIQELVMPEGDRDFSDWTKNIINIKNSIEKPLIVKQVGMGFSNDTIEKLISMGIKHIDVSGSGGTSFLQIEAQRSGKNYDYLTEFSLDTAEILLNLKSYDEVSIYASGGIRNPLDVIKALVLGAKSVGLSRWFLDLSYMEFDDAIKTVEDFILDLKKIMIITGAKSIKELSKVKYSII